MDMNGINDWVDHGESPYTATNVAKAVRHGRLRLEHEVLEDVADLFELYANVARLHDGPLSRAGADFTTAQHAVAGLAHTQHVASRTIIESGRGSWEASRVQLMKAVQDGTLDGRVFTQLALHWGPPAPKHTQDAAVPPPVDPMLTTLTRIRDTLTDLVDATDTEPNPLHDILVHAANMADDACVQRRADLPPTGYHAALHDAIRTAYKEQVGRTLSGSPDPYAPPFKIDAIESNTPSGFPLTGFTLTELHIVYDDLDGESRCVPYCWCKTSDEFAQTLHVTKPAEEYPVPRKVADRAPLCPTAGLPAVIQQLPYREDKV